MGRKQDEPGYADFERVLHRDEIGEYPQRRCRCSNHDQQPEVQLCFRPVIFSPSFHDTDLGRHVERCRRFEAGEDCAL